jgi:hypothetical protein
MDQILEGAIMTNEQINIAIAEACGWNSIREQDYDHGYSGDDVRQMWVGLNPDSDEFEQIPDYCNDLNAMHEAEKVFIGDDPENCDIWSDFQTNLIIACPVYLSYHATARQRAEAFLKTIGKWEE